MLWKPKSSDHSRSLKKGISAMHHLSARYVVGRSLAAITVSVLLVALASEAASAQASPFMTGATALQSNILAWLTPVAIILVMVLGGMAMANRMSWGWCIGAVLGIAIAFGAPQIVTWIRGMFGV